MTCTSAHPSCKQKAQLILTYKEGYPRYSGSKQNLYCSMRYKIPYADHAMQWFFQTGIGGWEVSLFPDFSSFSLSDFCLPYFTGQGGWVPAGSFSMQIALEGIENLAAMVRLQILPFLCRKEMHLKAVHYLTHKGQRLKHRDTPSS